MFSSFCPSGLRRTGTAFFRVSLVCSGRDRRQEMEQLHHLRLMDARTFLADGNDRQAAGSAQRTRRLLSEIMLGSRVTICFENDLLSIDLALVV